MHILETELTPLQRLIFAYASAKHRYVYDVIFALDNRCAAILRGTSEVMLGQMRLAWWRDVMEKAPEDRPHGDPVLKALRDIENQGFNLRALVPVVDAWELLLVSEELTQDQINDYAQQRGGTIFGVLAGHVTPEAASEHLGPAGELWALWDLARHSIDDGMRGALAEKLHEELGFMEKLKIPRALRPLSILVKLVHKDVKQGNLDLSIMRPATAAQIMWHGVTGL